MLPGEIQQQMSCHASCLHAKQLEFILVICWHSSVNGSVLLTEFSWHTWNGFKPIFVLQEEPHKSNLISLEAPGMNKDDAYIEVCSKEQQLGAADFLLFPKTPKQTSPPCFYASIPAWLCTTILPWQFC